MFNDNSLGPAGKSMRVGNSDGKVFLVTENLQGGVDQNYTHTRMPLKHFMIILTECYQTKFIRY